MSFFEGDADTRRTRSAPRPRRAAGGGGPSDPQAVLVRRGIALAGLLVLFVLLLLVVGSCRSRAKEGALKDYNREASSLGRESETQVGRPFFALLSGQGANGSPTDLQTKVSSLRAEAERQFAKGEKLDVPDKMIPAQRSLLIALELRRDGLASIAEKIRPALGDQGDAAEEATNAIAGQMQYFLASDVVYDARVRPLIRQSLDDAEIGGQTISPSRFVPTIAWLSPKVVAARLGSGGAAGDTGAGQDPTKVAPGTHGTGLSTVAVGDTTLESGAANRVPAAGSPTFNVAFANQGENPEQDVRVDVRVQAEGGRPITGSDTVDSVAQGATATATVRLPRAPTAGTAATVTVRVRPVPGEKKTDNNQQEYQVLFTG